jgi:hypothetical protein
MNFRITLLLFVFLAIGLSAQKVDLDKKNIDIKRTAFPVSPMLYKYQTYSVAISEKNGFFKAHSLNTNDYKSRINLQGFKKLSPKGDFKIDVVVLPTVEEVNQMQTKNTKTKEGKNVTKYYHALVLYVPIEIRFVDPDQKEIHRYTFPTVTHKTTWTSAEYNNPSELTSFLKDNWTNILSNEVKRHLDLVFGEINKDMNSAYGFTQTTENVVMYRLDTKSHPEYAEYDKHMKLIEAKFESLNPGADPEELKTSLQPSFDYFEQIVAKSKAEDKQQFELKKYSLINLIQGYFYSNQFDLYEKKLKELEAIGGKGYWDSARLMTNDEIRKAMKAINANNLYMVRDLSKIPDSVTPDEDVKSSSNTPAQNSNIEANLEKLKWNPTDRVVPGTYVDNKDVEYKGYYIIATSNDDDVVYVGNLQNIGFYNIENGKPKNKAIKPTLCKSIKFNEKSIIIQDYKSGALGARLEPTFMELVEETAQFKMYRVHDQVNVLDDKREIGAFYKSGLDKCTTIAVSEITWKKKAKLLFEDCPKIIAEIEKFKMINAPTFNQYRDWVRIYTNCK